jgi:hypothetical protein
MMVAPTAAASRIRIARDRNVPEQHDPGLVHSTVKSFGNSDKVGASLRRLLADSFYERIEKLNPIPQNLNAVFDSASPLSPHLHFPRGVEVVRRMGVRSIGVTIDRQKAVVWCCLEVICPGIAAGLQETPAE